MRNILGLALCFIFLSAVQAQEQKLEVTVYNRDLALIKDQREIKLNAGTNIVSFTDVAAQIDPTSVHLKSITFPEEVMVKEQNFEYDLLSADKLLSRYLDKKIKLISDSESLYEGKLLSFDPQQLILDQEGPLKMVDRENIREIEFPELPSGLITRPTLIWQIYSQESGNIPCELTYLTSGMDWQADYVAVVNPEDTKMDLNGWVTIRNESGTTYPEAGLKLIAGDVHRIPKPRPIRPYKMMAAEALAAEERDFEEEAVFEYHMYTLDRVTTLKDNQTKQISLLSASNIPVKKIYIYDGASSEGKVWVKLEFKNSQENGVGFPLPKGRLRVYKADSKQALQFIGEDEIDHTPKDEKVRVFLGSAFDVVGERKQTDYRQVTDRIREEAYEIKLRNHKDTDIEVVITEHLYGDWEVIKASHPYERKDARTMELKVLVKKDSEEVINYRVRYKW
ncbi:MAG: DUF4139 domain-containing protein [bacterium]